MTKPLWFGTGCHIPRVIAECPECGGELTARSMQWDQETGQPHAKHIDIECLDYLSHCDYHRWQQSDWQPIHDAIARWCGASYRVVARAPSE